MPSCISRRAFLELAAAAMLTRSSIASDTILSVPPDLDHILLGVNDLDHGIAWLEERSGVRAAFGGVHPGRGTRNALLALGPGRYLEIIAPDPQQAGSAASREFFAARLNALREPHLIGWAAHTDDLAAMIRKAVAAGIETEDPREGSRSRPDGKVLHWKSSVLKDDRGGMLPFFIEWNHDSIHPSQDAPDGCRLLEFSAESPAADLVAGDARKLGLGLEVKLGKAAVLHARISGKKSGFELT